jgi:hypothetical protein
MIDTLTNPMRSDSPHSRVPLPRVADLSSTTLDNLCYKHDRQTAACLWSVATARGFPRRFLTAGGFLVEVQELTSGASRHGSDSPVCILQLLDFVPDLPSFIRRMDLPIIFGLLSGSFDSHIRL